MSGDVELRYGERWLGTDKLTYKHDSETFFTEGKVRYQDRTFRFLADQAEGDQMADTLKLSGVQFQLNV